jgi:hypothetical protein
MRAAAVALVLIVGAAVVLWYGNTLNSLVLGGLIGGLAALLLSIPISLVLFSYFSRRHEDQLREEVREEMSLSQVDEFYDYLEAPEEDVYEAEAQMLPPAEYQRSAYNVQAGRNLVPSYPGFPPPRQNLPAATENQAYRQRTTEYPLRQAPGRSPRSASLTPTGRGNSARQPHPSRPTRYPGFPGYQPTAPRALHQTAALRTARQEAARQYSDDNFAVYPTGTSKKIPAVRPVQNLIPQQYRPKVNRPAQKLNPLETNQYRPKRTVDGSSVPPGPGRALPDAGESHANRASQEINYRSREQQTDQLGRRNPQTDQFRQPTGLVPGGPQTDQIRRPTGPAKRNPQVEAQRRNPDIITGSLQNPMIRRAPYMYEDDPLRYELAQQIDGPSVQRRASRYEEDEDQEY